MTDRILSQHNNVIAADFRPRANLSVTIEMTSEILYLDDHVMLTAYTGTIGDGPKTFNAYALADLNTGEITTL